MRSEKSVAAAVAECVLFRCYRPVRKLNRKLPVLFRTDLVDE